MKKGTIYPGARLRRTWRDPKPLAEEEKVSISIAHSRVVITRGGWLREGMMTGRKVGEFLFWKKKVFQLRAYNGGEERHQYIDSREGKNVKKIQSWAFGVCGYTASLVPKVTWRPTWLFLLDSMQFLVQVYQNNLPPVKFTWEKVQKIEFLL